jgi:DNA polymerase I
MQSGPTLLIDADILAYRHAAGGQRVYKFSENEEEWGVILDPFEQVVEEFKAEVDEWIDKFQAKAVAMAWSDTANFRKVILPSYKSNRKDVAKPLHLAALRAWGQANYKCYLRPTLEGDDVLGILATHKTLIRGEKIVISLDKDLKTIPCVIYNDGKDELRRISWEEADWWHMWQTLTGDTCDGYKGCPGIGPKRAAEIMPDVALGVPPGLWDAIVPRTKPRVSPRRTLWFKHVWPASSVPRTTTSNGRNPSCGNPLVDCAAPHAAVGWHLRVLPHVRTAHPPEAGWGRGWDHLHRG